MRTVNTGDADELVPPEEPAIEAVGDLGFAVDELKAIITLLEISR